MDLIRLGTVFRAVRVRRRLRQADVSARAGLSAASVGRAERGHGDQLSVGSLLAIAAALDIKLEFEPRWRGGELHRLLNAGHSAMHEQMTGRFALLPDWLAQPEVSFAIYGERGVIDILAFHPARAALLVIELKTELVDVQALIGTVDRYLRLARRIAAERGWTSRSVSGWVILRDTMTNRRHVAAHAGLLGVAFPHDGVTMRRWLREPVGTLRALSFLSDRHRRNSSGRQPGSRRVRVSKTGAARARGAVATTAAKVQMPSNDPAVTI
jgi:transcriptional regulator with XRE-family HTH domain